MKMLTPELKADVSSAPESQRHMRKEPMKNPQSELTQMQRDELAALDALPDDQIDTTDIPETQDWSGAVRGLFHMPANERSNALDGLRDRRASDSYFNDDDDGIAGQDWAGPTGYIGAYISSETRKTLDAYRSQPNLVAEHANHEEDTARGGYARRQLFELVQNGADALSSSLGGRIWIGLTRNYLYCADEGHPIDQDGVKALMFAYLSPKRGTDEIGRFGLGFKSVLGVTDTPEFFSRSGSFRFDRRAASELLQLIVPNAERYPVLRLPEPIDPDLEMEGDPILRELMDWSSNIVRLPLKDGAHENLERQMEEFPAEFLLFVEHVSMLTLQNDSHGTVRSFSLSKENDLYLLNDGETTTRWMIEKAVHELSSEARSDSRSLDDSGQVPISWAAPIESLGQPGVFWAYFPTVTSSLLAGILNAPWKTNEDRQNLLDGIYNREIIDAAASMVATALPKLSTANDPGRHLDALPRRREAGDNQHSISLRNRLYSILEDKEIVPDQKGILRKILEISYPPEGVMGEALEIWTECESRPRNWLHHSVLTINGQGRQARLGLTASSRNQPDWNWPVLRRVPVSEWLEALTTTAGSEQDKVQASKSAIRSAMQMRASSRGYAGLGKIILTSSGNWTEANPESIFLGGGSSAVSVTLVHSDLQNDPDTMAALRELGIRPASPEIGLKQAVSAWRYRQSDFPNYGYASKYEYEAWMDSNWKMYSEFPSDNVRRIREALADQGSVSGWHILFDFLDEDQITIPDYDAWMSKYWGLFWIWAREVAPPEAAGIIRDSRTEWREILSVHTIDGSWNLLVDSLLPGPVVPVDGSRDSNICIDVRYHDDDQPLLLQLGAVDSPRDSQMLSRHRLLNFTRRCRREFQQQDGLLSTPQDNYLNFETTVTSGPLDILEALSDEGRVEYTWRLLGLSHTYLPWKMRHDTRRNTYPVMEFPSPALRVLQEYGRIGTDDGIHKLSEALGASPESFAVLSKLLSHPKSTLICNAFGISAPDDTNDDDDVYWLPAGGVKAAREEVRAHATDELRLLAAVGKQELLKHLPEGLIEILEIENRGNLDGPQVAQAAIATFHTGALREYRDALRHLGPPRRWAGSPGAIAFVKSLGFGEEWAMEPSVRREPFMEVDGPYSLPELHGYQRKIVDKVRELIRSSDSIVEHRGMISMPTGSGKTRVAVQSIVEAIREDGFNAGILWVADRDELCEQAVEAWREVWASEGIQRSQLRISRMWGGQPTPLATTDRHVIVATIQTLYTKIARQPDMYEFLSGFKLLVFDEAHRSVAPSFTSVMQELGLTRWRRDNEPFLIGLTATPYRGRDERETERLVNRYGSNRLDEDAFLSDDPDDVIRELQAMQVLARADHATIEGGSFHLTGSELKLSASVPWLPQSVEERIASDIERTRRIVGAYRTQVSPDWPTLIFATSVEHARTVAALLTSKGISARAVSADTDTSIRRRIVEQFRSGEIKVLVNYGIFREGFDAPKTRAIIVARPVYSPNMYFQMIGRGLRGVKNGGNDRCLILNVSDNIDNFQRKLAFTELDWLWD